MSVTEREQLILRRYRDIATTLSYEELEIAAFAFNDMFGRLELTRLFAPSALKPGQNVVGPSFAYRMSLLEGGEDGGAAQTGEATPALATTHQQGSRAASVHAPHARGHRGSGQGA